MVAKTVIIESAMVLATASEVVLTIRPRVVPSNTAHSMRRPLQLVVLAQRWSSEEPILATSTCGERECRQQSTVAGGRTEGRSLDANLRILKKAIITRMVPVGLVVPASGVLASEV